jgi:myo-inositol-1-phosphate synthase
MAPHADDAKGFPVGNGHAAKTSAATELFTVSSPNVTYTNCEIKSKYIYRTTSITKSGDGKYVEVPKTGVMLVGWGGNNGTTVTAGIIANRRGLVWETKEGKQEANYYGSVLMGSTVKLGTDAETGEEINIPFHQMLPMVHPNDLVIGGWDISGMNLADAMDRAKVLEPTLKAMVRKEMAGLKPLPSIYYPDFIAANQEDRADNVLPGSKPSWDHVEQIRQNIR